MRRIVLLALALVTVSTASVVTSVSAQTRATSVHAVGGWTSSPCIPTVYKPGSGQITCHGSSTWDGTWTGLTAYKIRGTTNLISGDGRGTIDETFVGVDTATHRRGTMHFAEVFVIDGATGAIVIECRLIGATGTFAGYTGTVRFTGTVVSVLAAHGGYEGWLTRS